MNRQPLEPLDPNDPIVYVGSDENVSGKLEGEAIAKLLKGKGNVVIMMGELATQAAALRTEGVEKVFAQHPEIKVVQKQTANWRRNEAIDLMNNWLVAGTKIDAVAANNDEMAIGAIIALQQAGKDPEEHRHRGWMRPLTPSRKWRKAICGSDGLPGCQGPRQSGG